MVKYCLILRPIVVCEAGWQGGRILVSILEEMNYYRTNISALGETKTWLVYLVEGNLFFLI